MLLEFIDREAELKILEERYKSKTAEFIVIYGRRRVGKTELIKHFIEEKIHFYFLAKKKKMEEERERFGIKFSEKFNVFLKDTKDWDSLFNKMCENEKEKLVIVIDEFPFWIEKDKSILSDFQHAWDELLVKKNVVLILCGSYVSVMENEVLGYQSPLYGRRTAQIELNKLNFNEFKLFFPKWKIEEIINAYGALDGIPFYIKEFAQENNFFENICNTFWKKGSVLNKEVEFLLSQELREVETYLSIMRSIYEGATKLGEIASKSRVEITNINKYLKTLIDLKFVSTESPVIINRPKQKNHIYKITDNFFSFWLSYVHPFRDEIEIGEMEYLKEFFQKDYSSYLGNIFENICREKLKEISPIKITKIGRWWYQDKEIDIVALNEEKKEILFAECKWANLNYSEARKIIDELKEKSKFVNWERKKEHFCIMAKKLKEKQKLIKEGILAFDLEDF